jgi:hypothetical protein
MAGSIILQCHHFGQLLSFLISATKFFSAMAGEKRDNQFKDMVAYLAIPGPVGGRPHLTSQPKFHHTNFFMHLSSLSDAQ